MIELIEIQKEDIKDLILISYKGDADLLEKYHVEKFELSDAVESTLKMIEETEKQLQLSYFSVSFKSELIGYVITSGNHLYSFALNIKYRTKRILTEWWDEVKKVLGESFTCLLFSNNKRAINFLQKRGMKIEWENTENSKLNEVLLKY